MSIAVSIISAIIKSVVKCKVENELSNKLIGIAVDSVSEKGIRKINDFINNGKSKIENILSEEKMRSMDIQKDNIAYIVAEIKELLSYIEITDETFRQCKYDSLNLCSVLWNEYNKNKTYIECESDIKKSLLSVSEILIELLRESEGFVEEISIQISNTVDDTREEMRKEFNILKENFNKLDSYSQMILDILLKILVQNQISNIQKENRTQEYVDKWNANMFLNDFDEWDENDGVNVKLSDVYLDTHLPHFIYGNNKKKSTDLKKFLARYIETRSQNEMLLILGQPGIGKSTLITWITAHFIEKVDDILVYRFASDLKKVEWKSENITEKILKELGLSNEELNKKILILDGYDEISVKDDRKEILDQLYWELVKNNTIKCFSLIVTCRVNYIKDIESIQCKYITLQSWNKYQIKSFFTIFKEKTGSNIAQYTLKNIYENQEVLGIPLILYIVLALNISIEDNYSIVDVYDQVFSLEGGIYGRCFQRRQYESPHRINVIKKQIHQLSRNIALWMFENNSDEACIPQKEYLNQCKTIQKSMNDNEDIESDFLIGNFFNLKHCEGKEGEQLYFVHRSIYEYFVAEYIFSLIYEAIDSQEDLLRVCGKFLKGYILSPNMLEYLKIKISKSKLRDNFDKVKESFQIMLQDGMTYHASKYFKEPYKNVMDCEMNVFRNMLEFIHLWNNNIGFHSYIEKYLKYNYQLVLNLKGADLRGTNLKGAKLRGADLRGAKLIGSDISKADLSKADLRRADLREADLRETDLRGAKLMFAKFDEEQVTYLTNCNLLKSLVYVEECDRLIDYLEYQNMKEAYITTPDPHHSQHTDKYPIYK